VDVDAFTTKHTPEWQRLAEATNGGAPGLARLGGARIDEIVSLYLRVSGHLAEVQTRYHDPSLEAYLTQVVSQAHGAIYGGEPRSVRSLVRLFGSQYREALRRTMPFIAVMAALFVVVALSTGVWIGTSRAARAGVVPGLVRGFVRNSGPSPLRQPAASLSTLIMFNNIRVSLIAFATGVAFGLPTFFLIIQNAVLLGALAGASAAAGGSGRFWSLILPHGLLELTAIFVAAGAGLRIGWSLIDPGDRRRSEALAAEARDAVLVAIGVIPAFVIAGIIEGFLTPSGVPGALKITVGVIVEVIYLAFLFAPGFYKRPDAFSLR